MLKAVGLSLQQVGVGLCIHVQSWQSWNKIFGSHALLPPL